MKKIIAVSLILCLLLGGCGVEVPGETTGKPQQTNPAEETSPRQESTPAVQVPSAHYHDPQELFSDRDYRVSYEADGVITLNGTGASVSGKGLAVSGSVVTVGKKGTYVIRGSWCWKTRPSTAKPLPPSMCGRRTRCS